MFIKSGNINCLLIHRNTGTCHPFIHKQKFIPMHWYTFNCTSYFFNPIWNFSCSFFQTINLFFRSFLLMEPQNCLFNRMGFASHIVWIKGFFCVDMWPSQTSVFRRINQAYQNSMDIEKSEEKHFALRASVCDIRIFFPNSFRKCQLWRMVWLTHSL